MAHLNRILHILVALLAVVAVAIGWKLHQRRNELRDRGDLLAGSIESATIEMDKHSPEALADQYAIGPQGSGPLGWQEHHVDAQHYKMTLESFVGRAARIREQRDQLGDAIVDLAATTEHEDVQSAKLNDPTKAAAEIARVRDHLKQLYTRDNMLTEKLAKTAELLDSDFDLTPRDLRKPENYGSTQIQVETEIQKIQGQNSRHAKAANKLVETIGRDYFPGISSDDLQTMSPAALASMTQNYQRIRDKLDENVLLRQQIASLQQETLKQKDDLALAEDVAARLRSSIDGLTEDRNQWKAKYQDIYEIYVRKEGKAKGMTYDGKVVKVNYDYRYLIISLDPQKDKIAYGLELTVARNREYICQAKVSKLFKEYAVAEILNTDKIGEVIEGDRVVLLQ